MLNFLATTNRARKTPLTKLSADRALSATGETFLGIQITELENRCKTLRRRIGARAKARKATGAGVLPRKINRATNNGTNGRGKQRALHGA